MSSLTTPPASTPATGWRAFWERGGLWRAVLVAFAYIALYEAFGFGAAAPLLKGILHDAGDPLSSPSGILLGLALPIAFGSVLLIAFGLSLGWLPRPLFGAQPVRGRRWMWCAPALVLIPIVFHLIGTDYSRYTAGIVASLLFTGLFIGFAEEVLCRGFVVSLLRRRGYGEWVVMAVSSLIFGLLHASNALGGQPIGSVVVEVLYAIPFGVCMYIALRVTGNLVWPILLHAFTDPTTILASGGVDASVAGTSNIALVVATAGTFAYLAFALVAVMCTRGRAEGRVEAPPKVSTARPGPTT